MFSLLIYTKTFYPNEKKRKREIEKKAQKYLYEHKFMSVQISEVYLTAAVGCLRDENGWRCANASQYLNHNALDTEIKWTNAAVNVPLLFAK